MKKRYYSFVLIMLMSMFSLCASAHNIAVENADGVTIYYNYINNNTELEVTYWGSYSGSDLIKYTGNIVIPESVSYNEKTYSVTSIGSSAFSSCYRLTSITIPNSVTSIGSSAFSGCSRLTSITIPNSVTSIGQYAFFECQSLTSIDIPTGVTSISDGAFRGCSGLTSITIPNSVTSIGKTAFSLCSGLTSITIPNSVTNFYGGDAFYGCSNLTSVIWNAKNCADFSSDSYNTSPFYNIRTQIKEFDFGEGVERIPAFLCYRMTSLTSITIPNSVSSVGGSAFSGCSGLESVHISDIGAWCKISFGDNPLSNAHHLYLNGQEVKDLIIPNDVTSISGNAFNGCSGLTSVTIPNSVKKIGSYAFSGCSGLESVHISDIGAWCKIEFCDPRFMPTDYDNNPLKYAHHLYINGQEVKDLIIPYDVTSIGEFAFYSCSGLESVTIPNSATSIGAAAFRECIGLTSISLNCKTIDLSFSENPSIKEITIGEDVQSISGGAFYGCSGLTSVTWNAKNCHDLIYSTSGYEPFSGKRIKEFKLGEEVERIPAQLCRNLTSLTSVIIPKNVKSIGKLAFEHCTALTSITWNAKNCADLSSDYSEPFYQTKQIKEFKFGEEVERVPANLCNGMTELTSVTISKSVTSIGGGAFNGCSGLESVHISDIGAWCKISFGDNPLRYAHHLYINGQEMKDLIIPNDVTSITDNTFNSCSSLESVTIPNSVISIGNSAFSGCNNLTSITVGNSVASIGNGAFSDCVGLKSVSIGENVSDIGSDAFKGCSGLTSVTLLCKAIGDWFSGISSIKKVVLVDNVMSIGNNSFRDCRGITEITIPNSVTSIGNSAFYNCSLTSVKIPNSVTSIGGSAFIGNPLTSVIIGNGVETIGEKAFNGCGNLKSVIFGENVKSIGKEAFAKCIGLTSISTPKGASIGDNAFTLCSSLKEATICGAVGKYAFTQCYKLATLTFIGASIGFGAFRGSTEIRTIHCYMKSPSSFDRDCFESPVFANATLYVPYDTKAKYQEKEGWKRFLKIVEFDASDKQDVIKKNVILSSNGYATFYNEKESFELPKGLTAQVVMLDASGKLSYKTIAEGDKYDIIPKGVPVVLLSNSGNGGTYTLFSTIESASYSGENLLRGSDEQTITSNVNGVNTSGNPNYVYYKLCYGKLNTANADKLGWYWGAESGAPFTIEGGKAWLALPKSSIQSREDMLTIGDDATYINTVEDRHLRQTSDAQYNIGGQKVGDNYKGIIIVNGKKIIRK